MRDFSGVLVVKNPPTSADNERDADSIPGLGRSPGEGNGKALQHSCLENPTDRGAWGLQSMGLQSWMWLKQLRIDDGHTEVEWISKPLWLVSLQEDAPWRHGDTGGLPCDNKGRDWSYVAASQEIPKVVSRWLEARKKKDEFSPTEGT